MKTYEDVTFFYTAEKQENNAELYFRVIRIPTLDLVIGFKKDGFAHLVYTECALSRLDAIHQYGWLDNSSHTRMNHLLLTYAFVQYIIVEGKVPEEQINTLYFAALTHDVTGPALGDRVKHIAPDELDEEKTYVSWIKEKKIQKFTKKFGIDTTTCIHAVQGKNSMGTILDWADKIAYTYFDIAQIKENYPSMYQAIMQRVGLYRQSFKTPLIHNLTPGNIVKKGQQIHTTLRCDENGCIGSTEEQIFVCFAILRAALFETVCFTSAINAVYGFYGYVIIPYMLEQNEISISFLLEKTDKDVAEKIAKFLEVPEISTDIKHYNGQWWFATEKEAIEKVDQEREKEGTIAWIQTSGNYGFTCVSPIFKLHIYHNGIMEKLRDIHLRLPFLRKAEEYQGKKFHVISVGNLHVPTETIEKLRNFLKK